MTTTVNINGRNYTVQSDGSTDGHILADVFNSRGGWAGFLVRDSANADNCIIAGNPFKSVNTKAAARHAVEALGL